MIHHLDNSLRDLFMSQILRDADTGEPILTPDAQVGFRAPDNQWRAEVNDLDDEEHPDALNVYLFDIRGNRKLRSASQGS